MRIKALLFDVFGTCVDWRSSVAREVAEVLPAVDPYRFADEWRREYDPAMACIRDGDRGYVPLDILHRENLDRVAERHGVVPEHPADLARVWERLDPWPDVVPGLTALRAKALIAPCSNGSIALMTHLARHAALPWDCVLGAEIARDYKPSETVYRASCAALQIAPSEVMMVAAHPDDLAAASAAGLRTGYVPRPTEWGPDAKALAETGPWDIIAEDFLDLTERLP